jgi:hypothetical protein
MPEIFKCAMCKKSVDRNGKPLEKVAHDICKSCYNIGYGRMKRAQKNKQYYIKPKKE